MTPTVAVSHVRSRHSVKRSSGANNVSPRSNVSVRSVRTGRLCVLSARRLGPFIIATRRDDRGGTGSDSRGRSPGAGREWKGVRCLPTFVFPLAGLALCAWIMASLTLGWVQLAAVVGALQGLVLTVALAAQRSNRTANRLLAALMATMTVYLAAGPYYAAGLIRIYPHFFGINYPTPWLFGPLVYLYARAASDRSWRFTPKALVHFAPATLVIIAVTPFYVMSGAEKIAMFERWSASGVTGALAYLDPTKYVSGIAYSAATAVYLVHHRRDVERSYSN